MGSGIAQVAAQSGHQVTLVEINEGALKAAKSSIETNLKRVAKKVHKDSPEEAEKFVTNALSNLKTTMNVMEPVQNTDLIVEAVVESINVKQKLFSSIDPIAPKHTIFTSNTSALSIQAIASVTKRKDRFGGLHFFNPVPVMRLLEVIRTPETSDDTYKMMVTWGKAIGKTTITCDATVQDIDTAMKLGAGYPMGPFELLDYIGLDTHKSVSDGWYKKFPTNPTFKPSTVLEDMVAKGKLGVKSGEGFYKYDKTAKL